MKAQAKEFTTIYLRPTDRCVVDPSGYAYATTATAVEIMTGDLRGRSWAVVDNTNRHCGYNRAGKPC